MLIKSSKSSKGASYLSDYLVRNKDNKGVVRESIELLRGDINLTTQLAISRDCTDKVYS